MKQGTGKKTMDTIEYVLQLFIIGASPNSARAISNIRNICTTHLQNNYSLEIIDVYQQPMLAQKEQIIALPMLLKRLPVPSRRLVGDMSDTNKVLKGLGFVVNYEG